VLRFEGKKIYLACGATDWIFRRRRCTKSVAIVH